MSKGRIHIVGRKNSGKTTLVVELVGELSRRGIRVATIKHTHHHHELDAPGKDSHRHREAGALAVGIMAPGMTATFVPQPNREDSNSRMDELIRLLPDCDLVLVEGGQHLQGDKVEVWRRVVSEEPLARTNQGVLAVISDDAIDELPCPQWPRSDLSRIADQLQAAAGLSSND